MRVLGFYVDTMRAVPVLVVLVWAYFALPLADRPLADAVHAPACSALGIHLAAYVAETIRAGLTSVRPGQMRAALALGMSRLQAIRTIVLPQALIRMLPPLGSLLVDRDQGQRHRLGDRRAGTDAADADRRRQDLPAVRALHRRDAGLFPDLLSRWRAASTASTGGSPISGAS